MFKLFRAQHPKRPSLTIALPTLNSARYIDIVLRYYAELDIDVRVFVDRKSVDDTYQIASHLRRTRWTPPGGVIVEDVLPSIAALVKSDWLLRIDDDELPSRRMLDYVWSTIARDDIDVVGFPRYQCAVSTDGRLLRSLEHSPFDHGQWRLFRIGPVDFKAAIHTAGFDLNGLRHQFAPKDCYMIHLDWALHSYEERVRKVERYDAYTDGAGSRWRSYYLYEEGCGSGAHQFAAFEAPEFAAVATEISSRFPQLCIRYPPDG